MTQASVKWELSNFSFEAGETKCAAAGAVLPFLYADRIRTKNENLYLTKLQNLFIPYLKSAGVKVCIFLHRNAESIFQIY